MGFNGKRLRNARIYRNMTITELSNSLEVSKQAVSQYEKGDITPKPEVVFRIINTLKFPVTYFTENDGYNMKVDNTFFRALASAKKLDLDTQEIKTTFIAEIYEFLLEYFDLPLLALPERLEVSNSEPESEAIKRRKHWGLGERPIKNVVSLLEQNGVVVSSFKTESEKIDAFTQMLTINNIQRYCVVLGNNKISMVRRNFSAAHELGHIMMHSGLINVRELSSVEFKDIEREANQFASAFLLPRESFYIDLKYPTELDFYLELKKKWRVSVAAMIFRARDLERISNTEYQKLMKQMSYKGWRKSEPYDSVWNPPTPQLFKNAIEMLIENEIMTGPQFVTELSAKGISLRAEEIEYLLDLEDGVLSRYEDQDTEGVVLKLKR